MNLKNTICIFGLVIFLSGCSAIQPLVNRFLIAPFDSNEYALVNELRTTAIQAKPFCNTKDDPVAMIYSYVEKIYTTSLLLKNYSQYLPKNDQTIKPVNLVFQMTTDLRTRYEKEDRVSKTYCELKMESIEEAAELIQKAIGKRPRP